MGKINGAPVIDAARRRPRSSADGTYLVDA